MSEFVFDDNFLKKLNSVKLYIKSQSNSNLMGGRKSNAKGSSVEFSDYREYNFGDDLRRVDWNAYGRFDKIYVKLYREEREGIFNIFLDSSESMNYGEKSKRIMSMQIVAGMAYMILNNLDRVGIHTINDGILNKSKGKTGLYNYYSMLKELNNIQFKGSTGFHKAIKQFDFKYRGVAVLVSDFYEIDDLEEVLQYLSYKKQEIILIRVLSEEEISPEISGSFNLLDAEDNLNTYKVDVTSSLLRDYKNSYDKFTTRLQELAKKYHGELEMVSTGDSFEQILINMGRR